MDKFFETVAQLMHLSLRVKGHFRPFYKKYHDIERLGRLLVSFGIVQMQQRFDDLHFATAAQRYQTLMNSNPTFIQRVPLGMIASYLAPPIHYKRKEAQNVITNIVLFLICLFVAYGRFASR